MPPYTWIKLYTEVLDDPKMGRLPDYLWRRAIELFLLAGREGNDGALPPVNVMGWALRLDDSKLVASLTALSAVGVVHETEPGRWSVTNFAKRQSALSDKERQQRHRAGVTKKSRDCHEVVTEVEGESTPTTTAKNVFSMYQENFGALTQMIAEELKDLEATYTEIWVKAAMTEALSSEVRNLKYVAAILRRWKTDGFQTKKKELKSYGNQQQPKKTEHRGNGNRAVEQPTANYSADDDAAALAIARSKG